jgi:hypothetical protein
VCWSIVLKEKPPVGCPYFGAFPSDSISKANNQLMKEKFRHAEIPEYFTSKFWEFFESIM